MERSIDPQVRSDIANETMRHYGELSEDFPQKMRKRINRKFRTESADVDIDRFDSVLIRQYPNEDKKILEAIRDWVIYYEYLR